MWAWLAYIGLALFANTAIGPPFEPVLVWFTTGRRGPEAWALIVTGSLCAGLAGALEGSIGRRIVKADRIPALARPFAEGRRFYVFAAAGAASPLPFTLVRVAALTRRPHPMLYGAAVAVGRLPRYAVIVLAWNRLGLPGGVAVVAPLVVLAAVLARRWIRRPGRPAPLAADQAGTAD